MSTVINGPTSSPAPQQLVVAQCAMQTDKDLIFGAHNAPIKEQDFKDHHVCVAAHTPVWYDRAGLHSSRINKDVIQVSACGSLPKLGGKGINAYSDYLNPPNVRTGNDDQRLLSLQVLGVAQTAISDGAGVRASPEAMGRLGVAIGGLVPMTMQSKDMDTAKIGDFIHLSQGVASNCTISGAPKGFRLLSLGTMDAMRNGRPREDGGGIIAKGPYIGRIFQFGPGIDEVQVLLC